jgi:hypothetical protein
VRTLAVALTAISGLMAASAQASTAPTASHGALVAAHTQQSNTVRPLNASADCPTANNYCHYDSGWDSNYYGACRVHSTVDWWRSSNTMNVQVEVYSPYLFAGCVANVTVHFGSTIGYDFTANTFYGVACSQTDPTCGDDRTISYYNVASTVPAVFEPFLQSIWTADAP